MVIGITGGVGSGKSAVLNYLREQYPCTVIEADKVGHMVQEPGQKGYDAVVNSFGRSILSPTGEIDRKKLGDAVFADREKLNRLNGILHPIITEEIIHMIEEGEAQHGLVFLEAALLLETPLAALCHKKIYIYTEEAVRMKRLAESRGYTQEKTRSIIRHQLSDELFIKHCDEIVHNSGSLDETEKEIDKILQRLQTNQ